MKKIAPLAVVALLIGAFALSSCSGPRLLNTLAANPDRATTIKRDVQYGAAPRQAMDIYVPDGDGPHPILVFFHGGSWNSGSKGGYAFVGKRFASLGYVTAVANYRLAPDHPYPAFMEDAASAVAKTISMATDINADTTRIFLSGHSAGGYMAAQLAVAPEFLAAHDLPATVIDGVAGIAGPYDFLPSDSSDVHDAFGRDADKEITMPVYRVTADAPPMLLLVGGADTDVWAHNGVNMAAALEAAGVPVTLKTYPDADHDDTIIAVALYQQRLSPPIGGRNLPVAPDIAAFFDALPSDRLQPTIGE